MGSSGGRHADVHWQVYCPYTTGQIIQPTATASSYIAPLLVRLADGVTPHGIVFGYSMICNITV